METGASVPGYRVLRLVGSGAVATIFLAEGPAGERVAVKFINSAVPSGSRGADELRHEFRVLSMLSHPSIPKALGMHNTDRGTCMVREYCGGECLRKLMREEPRRVIRLLPTLLERAGEALQHMHDRGFVHRDFKPENVVLGEQGEVYLVDMALAWRRRRFFGCPSLAGTPVYMAPELFSGKRPSPLSDAYSYAVTAYEILTGKVPYEGSSREEVLLAVRRGGARPPRERNRSVSTELDRLVMQGLAPDPARRPADLAVYGHRLAEAVRSMSLAIPGR